MAIRHNTRPTRAELERVFTSVAGFIFTPVQKYFSGPLTRRGGGDRAPSLPVDPPLVAEVSLRKVDRGVVFPCRARVRQPTPPHASKFHTANALQQPSWPPAGTAEKSYESSTLADSDILFTECSIRRVSTAYA